LTLRFAGDFGLFRMMRETTMSYRQLPIRVYELSPSFRLEQRGECVGLKRLRAFTMPDIHCFCKDLEQGMGEYKELFNHYTRLTESMKVDYVVAFRVYRSFYEENQDWFADLLKIVGQPALIELLPERRHYWIVKHEYQAVDAVGGTAQLCTVQLDVEDAERYGIMYVDADGSKRGCVILHSSMGSIERWIYAILEQAEKMRRAGKPPMLPVWLSPTQVRILPVSREYIGYAKEVAAPISERGIRVDVDDRDETLGSKVRDAEMEWVPYIIVVGGKEVKEKRIAVRSRLGKRRRTMRVGELVDLVDGEIGDMPKAPLYLPKYLSMRPKFM
ncbi:MAG: His/Gly/Thr/Pro-type tRNA ligase C-terminal domain-containing protein, partial [Candidatus Bathyarchaeia archaeon]